MSDIYNKNKKNSYLGILLIFLVITLFSFALIPSVSAQENETTNQTQAYIDPAVLAAFEQNQTWVSIGVKYKGDIPVTFENEREMVVYYFNSSVAKSFFGYIPETEIKNIQGGLSALQPFFTAKVTREGFNKLANNSRITKINLDIPTYSSENQSESKNVSLLNNKTINEKTKEKKAEIRLSFLLVLVISTIILLIVILLISKKTREK